MISAAHPMGYQVNIYTTIPYEAKTSLINGLCHQGLRSGYQPSKFYCYNTNANSPLSVPVLQDSGFSMFVWGVYREKANQIRVPWRPASRQPKGRADSPYGPSAVQTVLLHGPMTLHFHWCLKCLWQIGIPDKAWENTWSNLLSFFITAIELKLVPKKEGG